MKNLNRPVIVILIIWTFIHVYLLIEGMSDGDIAYKEKFYPFTYEDHGYLPKGDGSGEDYHAITPNFSSYDYDYREFLIYVIGPWLGLFVYYFLKKK